MALAFFSPSKGAIEVNEYRFEHGSRPRSFSYNAAEQLITKRGGGFPFYSFQELSVSGSASGSSSSNRESCSSLARRPVDFFFIGCHARSFQWPLGRGSCKRAWYASKVSFMSARPNIIPPTHNSQPGRFCPSGPTRAQGRNSREGGSVASFTYEAWRCPCCGVGFVLMWS